MPSLKVPKMAETADIEEGPLLTLGSLESDEEGSAEAVDDPDCEVEDTVDC